MVADGDAVPDDGEHREGEERIARVDPVPPEDEDGNQERCERTADDEKGDGPFCSSDGLPRRDLVGGRRGDGRRQKVGGHAGSW